jgi:hypothetical protein
LVASIAAQSPIIYQPLARELATLYMAAPAAIGRAQNEILSEALIVTGAADIAAEFGTEFMMQIAHEIVTELGIGLLASLAVPAIGAIVGAALDYLIATQMTWRVGTMVSMFFQNGGAWVGNRKSTFDLAKGMTGKITLGLSDVLSGSFKSRTGRVDLNSIPHKVASIRESQLRSVKALLEMMRAAMSHDQIRAAAKRQGIPIDLIEEALSAFA